MYNSFCMFKQYRL
jgi:hypothetical protein